MKVCIISSIFPPYTRGGAEMVGEETARMFTEVGHDVFVITCAPFEGGKSLAGRWQSEDSLRIFRFTPLNLFTYFNLSKYPPLLRLIWHVIDMFNPHTYLVVRRILREEKPDLIITRNLKGLGYTIPMAIRSTLHAPRSTTKWFHGLHDLGALHPRGYMEWGKENVIRNPMPLTRLYRAACRKLFGSPDVVIAPSQFVLDEYNRAGFFSKSKKVVMKNPVPPLNLPLIKGEKEAASRFLFVGQLEPYKGLRVLISAWRKFVADNPRATLEIIGRGSMEKEVQRATQMIRGIIYRGFIPHHELPAVTRNARALVFPSLAYETFGITIVESFSVGVPVIGSRIGAVPEIITDGINGILIPPGDPEALTLAMTRMLGKERDTLSEDALKSAIMSSPAAYRDRLLELYSRK